MTSDVAPGSVRADPNQWRDLADSEERAEFAAAVGAHLGSRFGPAPARACFDGEQPAGVWDEIAGADYPLIGLPEEMGGVGTVVDAVTMMEAAGRALVPLPLLSGVMAWQTLARAGVARDLSTAGIAALAVDAGSDPASCLDRSGTRLAVLDGALAQEVVVVDVDGPGVVVSLVDPAGAIVAVHRHVDPSRPVAELDRAALDGARGAEVGCGVDTILAPARTVLAADLTGIAAAALDRAVQHALEREQFGKQIGAFQGIKHRLADVYVAVERARSLTRAAAVALVGEGTSDASPVELALLAKAAAGEAATDSTRAYVQVLGAMGMTFEADAHLYFRRAQQTAPVLGSAAACYRRAAVIRRDERR